MSMKTESLDQEFGELQPEAEVNIFEADANLPRKPCKELVPGKTIEQRILIAQAKLERARTDYQAITETPASKSDELIQSVVDKEDELIKMFQGLKALILENKVEREAAKKTIDSGHKNAIHLEREISTTEKAVHMLNKLRDSLKEVCQMYSVYDQFVHSTNEDPRYISIEVMKNRYDSLKNLREELLQKYWSMYATDVKVISERYAHIRELMTQICVQTYRLAGVENMGKEAKAVVLHWEHKIADLKSKAQMVVENDTIIGCLNQFISELVQVKELPPNALSLPLRDRCELLKKKFFQLQKIVQQAQQTRNLNLS